MNLKAFCVCHAMLSDRCVRSFVMYRCVRPFCFVVEPDGS